MPGQLVRSVLVLLACWGVCRAVTWKAGLAVVSAPVVAAVAFVAFGVFIALAYRQQWQWTGLPAPREEEGGSGRSAKTLWDWLQLLGIPVALAALAFLLNDAQTQRDQQREEAQTRRDQRREEQRAAQQQKKSEDAEREDTLRAYLTQMSELMLNDNLQSKPNTDVRNVARTATLTAVRRLDGSRKGLVVRFLFEARLLQQKRDLPPVAVAEADLVGADLRGAILVGAGLSRANLRRADLHRAVLFRADLYGANLRDADLRGALLFRANLLEADLRRANLRGARLRDADLFRANLSGANLIEADLFRANLIEADLRRANLRNVDLRDADLRGAHLSGANLRGAHLRNVDLRKADLRNADLRKADLYGANLRGARHAELAETRGIPARGP